LKKEDIEIDFSRVANLKFTCLEDCGRCCFFQAPVLTTFEINRALSYLKTLDNELLEDFTLDWISSLNLEINGSNLKNCMESLFWFWSPFQMQEAYGKIILVVNYTVHSMPSSGRCKLLNPLRRTCLVYPARPDTCRLYPFTEKTDTSGKTFVDLAMENCPGISRGSFNLDREQILELRKRGLEHMAIDIIAYKKYLKDNNLKINKTKMQSVKLQSAEDINEALQELEKNWRDSYYLGKKSGPSYKGKRFIEPLAELGMIPKHPLLTLWNENFEKT